MVLLPFCLLAEVNTGVLCIAPVPLPTPGEISLANPTGGGRTFNFEIQIDKLEPIKTDHTETITLKDLSLEEKHLVQIRRDGKISTSFWFNFAERGGKNLCLWFKPLYETWNLWPASKCGSWCICNS